MEKSTGPVGAHLVGSVPLADAEEVFRRSAKVLGARLRRIPDGETGERADWIAWQYPHFSCLPQFDPGSAESATYGTLPQLRLRPGERTGGLEFGDLGYAEAAISAYAVFARLKEEGAIPRECRMLVSLPTPLAPVSAFVALENQAALEPPYEEQMFREVERIAAAIPPGELAIQWDARYEFAMLEGAIAVWFPDVRAGIVERLLRYGDQVPEGVELGFHLCYGDEEHGHFCEPEDANNLVDIANDLAEGLARPLDWIHIPVPRGRNDDDYFAPLGHLRLGPETELYLGLLHPDDGTGGARRRIAIASRHVSAFGVATECGWGRADVGDVGRLLELHREVSEPVPDQPLRPSS
jgi:hypothetical protein